MHSRHKPHDAGKWIEDKRTIAFEFDPKRERREWKGEALWSAPMAGSPDDVSKPYDPITDQPSMQQSLEKQTEGMPDFFDMKSPGFVELAQLEEKFGLDKFPLVASGGVEKLSGEIGITELSQLEEKFGLDKFPWAA